MQKKKIIEVLKFLKKELKGDNDALEAIGFLENKAGELNFKEAVAKESKSEDGFSLPSEVKNANAYALFSDGGSRGNPGPGAWGAVGQSQAGDILFEASSVETLTTNNKMELGGAIAALEWMIENQVEVGFNPATDSVFLYSDSKYVIDGTNSWMPGWKKRGWKKADKKAPENLDLWQQMDQVVAKFGALNMKWVKGHNGHPQNEHCDFLVNKALDESGF